MQVRRTYSFALTSGDGALASLFRVTLPVLLPSPKKITSTVKSSLITMSKMDVGNRAVLTCSALKRGLEELTAQRAGLGLYRLMRF